MRTFCLITLLLGSLFTSGCYTSVPYEKGYLPRTPQALQKSIKNGSVTVVVDEPLLSAMRKQGPETMVGGAVKIEFPAGEFIKNIATAVITEAVSDHADSRAVHYTYRVKDVKFFFRIKDVSFFHQNGNFYTKAALNVEIRTSDGKTLLSRSFECDEQKAFDSKLAQQQGLDKCMSVAITEAMHKTVCQSIEEFLKHE